MKALFIIAAITLTTGNALAVFEIIDMMVLKRIGEIGYDEQIAVDSAPELWLEKAGAYMSIGKYDEAVKAYDAALAIKPIENNPDMYNAVNGKGLALIYLGKYDEAIDWLGGALETAGDAVFPVELGAGAYLHNTAGVARYRKGEYGEAFYHFNVAHNYISIEVKSLVAYNCAAAFAYLGNTEMTLPYVEEFCRASVGDSTAGHIFESGKPVSTDIDLAERAKQDEAFKDYWEDPEFLEIVGE